MRLLDSRILGRAGSLGAAGISMTRGLQSKSSQGYIVTFDLSTSSGKKEYQYLINQGQLPPKGHSYTVQANIEGKQHQKTSGINFL